MENWKAHLDRNNRTTLQDSIKYCSWMFLYFSTISCIVVNTVCNYFWSPCILNFCKCVQIAYIFYRGHRGYQSGFLKYQLCVCFWLNVISKMPQKVYKPYHWKANMVSWAEKYVCVHNYNIATSHQALAKLYFQGNVLGPVCMSWCVCVLYTFLYV